MESAEGQLKLIKVWANGTNFEVDMTRSPKANFAGLAKAQGWVGGDANWQLHWEACFKETYLFGRHAVSSAAPAQAVAPLNLEERSRRRLSSSSENSATSTDSNFSLISAAPSIQSLDTNGSVFGGIVLGLGSVNLNITEDTQDPASNIEATRSRPFVTLTLYEDGAALEPSPGAAQSLPVASPFWYEYPGFEPDPRAPFKHELGRLSKHLATRTKKEKKDLQAQALTAEINFHYGAHMNKLDRWQELCKEVGIEKIPTSISQCQKALKPIFVNLFNLVDHRRNPDHKVLRFQTYGEFSKFTRKGNEFPRDCAKQEGFIKVLLKKL